MALEKVSVILKDADKNKYGVAAFNIFNYETIAWAITVAEEERMPVIIQFYPGFDRYIPMKVVTDITRELASKSKMPVGLHLDHSNTYDLAISGAYNGFPSIMIDASTLDFDENVKVTRQVVEAAGKMGVEVEAELGHVGSGNKIEDFTDSNRFTDPEDAAKFVELTGVDSLAISIGNGHGQYVATPSLDFDRITKIHNILDIPLVMHGGSDIPDEQLKKSVNCGMSKYNIATEYNRSFYNSIKNCMDKGLQNGYMYRCLNESVEPVKEFIREKIRVLNPNSYSL